MADYLAHGTGRRKTSVARVHLTQGTGEININGKKMDEYFTTLTATAEKGSLLGMVFKLSPVLMAAKIFKEKARVKKLIEINEKAKTVQSAKDVGDEVQAEGKTWRLVKKGLVPAQDIYEVIE